MKTHHKLTALALVLTLGMGGSFVLAQSSTPTVSAPPLNPGTTTVPGGTTTRRGEARGPRSGQPRMEEAIISLREARRLLDMAEHDKGGFRDKAIESTDRAIKDVEDGIQYARDHAEEFRGARGRGRRGGTGGETTPPAGS